jgi:hypothetical protein
MPLLVCAAAATAAAAWLTATAPNSSPPPPSCLSLLAPPPSYHSSRAWTAACCFDPDEGTFVIQRGTVGGEPLPPYTAETTLGGCDVLPGTAAVEALRGSNTTALRASKQVRCPNGLVATVIDTITNISDSSTGGGLLSWGVSVSSSAPAYWTAPIVSTVTFSGHTAQQRYWFGGSTGGKIDLDPIEFGKCDHYRGEPQLPAGACDFKLGGDYADPTTPPNEVWTNQMVLPVWSYYSSVAADAAVALVQSPLREHAPVFARLRTQASDGASDDRDQGGGGTATLSYSRELSRLGNGSLAATFQQFVLHTAVSSGHLESHRCLSRHSGPALSHTCHIHCQFCTANLTWR